MLGLEKRSCSNYHFGVHYWRQKLNKRVSDSKYSQSNTIPEQNASRKRVGEMHQMGTGESPWPSSMDFNTIFVRKSFENHQSDKKSL